jgi:DNA-directed RNA polymerase specialized sigma24 family protein
MMDFTGIPELRQPSETFDPLPEEAYRPQSDKIRTAPTHLYETGRLADWAGDYISRSPNPDKDAEELAHFTYTDLYRGTAFSAVVPLIGTVEENAEAIRPWVRRALNNDATDLARRRQSQRKYIKAERQRLSRGTYWASSGSPNESKRSSDPLQDYFARESFGGNQAYAAAFVAELRLRWPHSIAPLMLVYGHGEPMTEVAKTYGVAPRTIRDRVEHTRKAMQDYGEWERTRPEPIKDNPLAAAVDAMERIWAKSGRR